MSPRHLLGDIMVLTRGKWFYENEEKGYPATFWEPGDPGFPATIYTELGDDDTDNHIVAQFPTVYEFSGDENWPEKEVGNANDNARLCSYAKEMLRMLRKYDETRKYCPFCGGDVHEVDCELSELLGDLSDL